MKDDMLLTDESHLESIPEAMHLRTTALAASLIAGPGTRP
jgi:hypothetical protein